MLYQNTCRQNDKYHKFIGKDFSVIWQITVKHFLISGLHFCVNWREQRDVKIKSSPIISYVWNIEGDMKNQDNILSLVNISKMLVLGK